MYAIATFNRLFQVKVDKRIKQTLKNNGN